MMMNKKNIFTFLLAVLIICLTVQVEGKDFFFESNLEKLKGLVTAEDLDRFLKADVEYLKDLKDKEVILKEIDKLEEVLDEVNKEYQVVRGVKIYKGNTGLKNDGIRKAIVSRKRLLENNKFDYDLNTVYTIDREYAKERSKGKKFTQEEMDITYKAVAETIKNIELDTNFLKETKFVISPYELEGINGYTVTRSNNKNAVVIGIKLKDFSKEKLIHAVKSTTLHEIGHVFHHMYDERLKSTKIGQDYLIFTDTILSNSKEGNAWQRSVDENFAEDFRMYFSTRMGSSSITPGKKKTIMEYNEADFKKVVDIVNKMNIKEPLYKG